MSEKEKRIMKTLDEVLPEMDEFEKGYFLGYVDSKVADKRKSISVELAQVEEEVG